MIDEQDKPTSPYIGPSPFESKHQTIFFGRDIEADTLLSLMIAERVVLFYAQSGAGKSSLVNAKIIPKLTEQEYIVLQKARVGLDADSIKDNISNVFVYSALSSIAPKEVKPESYAQYNLPSYREWISLKDESKRRWLIFDQFEELLTTNQDRWEDRKGFFEQIALALEYDKLLSVMFVIRSDYVAGLDLYTDLLPNKLRTRFYMELLKRQSALEAIQKPAKEFGCTFEDDAANKLVKKLSAVNTSQGKRTGEYVESVLLQVVCQDLWSTVKDKSVINKENVKDFKVEDALKKFYESSVKEVIDNKKLVGDEKNVEEQIRKWFAEKLIIPPGIRGQVMREKDFSGEVKTKIADEFVKKHLLRIEDSRGAEWFELSHDRLVKPIIDSNKIWLSQNENQYQKMARLWVESNYSEDLLLKSFDLSQAEEWKRQQTENVGEGVEYFLESSRACEDKRRANEAESRAQALAEEKERVIKDALVERETLLKQAESERIRLLQIAESEKADLERETEELQQRNEKIKKSFIRFRAVILILLIGACVAALIYAIGFYKYREMANEKLTKELKDEREKAENDIKYEREKAAKRLKLLKKSLRIDGFENDDFFVQVEAADNEIIRIEKDYKDKPFEIHIPQMSQEPRFEYIFDIAALTRRSYFEKDDLSSSDCIYYVSEKPTTEYDWKVQYVAYLLLRAGLPVRVIMRTVSTEKEKSEQSKKYPGEAIGVIRKDWNKEVQENGEPLESEADVKNWKECVIVSADNKLKLKNKKGGGYCSLTLEQIKNKDWKACFEEDKPRQTQYNPRP